MSEQISITEACNKACEELRKMHRFNGIPVIEANCKTVDQRRAEGIEDGELSTEENEQWIRDYCCCQFLLEYYDAFERSDNPYVSTEFDLGQLERDFKEFLLPFFGGDKSLIPNDLDFHGGDTEFMRQAKFVSASDLLGELENGRTN